MDPSGSLFAPENRQQLEASFREFLKRPENRPLVEQQQAEEVVAALDLQEQQQEAELHSQVQQLPTEYQQLLHPILKWPVLRRLLLSLSKNSMVSPPTPTTTTTNSSNSSSKGRPAAPLLDWLSNDRVMALLRQATKALRSGKLTEQQLEQVLLSEVEASWHQQQQQQELPPGAAWQGHGSVREQQPVRKAPSAAQVVVPSAMLVEALNEHLAERRAGKQACSSQDWGAAVLSFTRALAIVEFVRGSSPQEQREVDANAAAVLVELASVHMATQEWGAAVQCCTKALRMVPSTPNPLLLRAKAYLAMHEHEAALADVKLVLDVDPWNEEAPALARVIRGARIPSCEERQLAARMLRL